MGMIWVGFRREETVARALLKDADAVEELLDSDDESSVDLDKAWHGLHWLLAGGGAPLDEAVLGGEEIGEDLGYGPSRLLAPDRVAVVAQALQDTSNEALADRFDARAMDDQQEYPSIWDEDDVFDDYLAPAFIQLRDFYAAAAAAGDAVIQTIC